MCHRLTLKMLTPSVPPLSLSPCSPRTRQLNNGLQRLLRSLGTLSGTTTFYSVIYMNSYKYNLMSNTRVMQVRVFVARVCVCTCSCRLQAT